MSLSSWRYHTPISTHDGEGLGVMFGEEKTREYRRAGFRAIETRQRIHDMQNNQDVVKKAGQ